MQSSSTIPWALLGALSRAGATSVSKTALVKFAYLLDLYQCGVTKHRLTSWDWRFLHFGPFSGELIDALDAAVKERKILVRNVPATDDGDGECALYAVLAKPAPALSELGVSAVVMSKLLTDAKRYRESGLPALLNYVYFHTRPMERARPGESLDFAECGWDETASARPVEMKKLPEKKVAAVRERLQALVKSRAPGVPVSVPNDDVYQAGLRAFDEAGSLDVGLSGTAAIRT